MKKILIFSFFLIFSTGCANPLYKPSAQMASAILPEYTEYVKTDVRLDSAQKERRIEAAAAYTKMLQEYKNIEGE